jgi:hypothetical protein
MFRAVRTDLTAKRGVENDTTNPAAARSMHPKEITLTKELDLLRYKLKDMIPHRIPPVKDARVNTEILLKLAS